MCESLKPECPLGGRRLGSACLTGYTVVNVGIRSALVGWEIGMSTNGSGKLNMGGVSAIKDIIVIPISERSSRQSEYLDACLTALAHQPSQWYAYQDWGEGGPVRFLAERGIEFRPCPGSQSCAAFLVHWV